MSEGLEQELEQGFEETGGVVKVGILSPPWLPVPPRTYGGTESMVDVRARGLAAAGHDVHLFATAGSTSPVRRSWIAPVVREHARLSRRLSQRVVAPPVEAVPTTGSAR